MNYKVILCTVIGKSISHRGTNLYKSREEFMPRTRFLTAKKELGKHQLDLQISCTFCTPPTMRDSSPCSSSSSVCAVTRVPDLSHSGGKKMEPQGCVDFPDD